MAVNHAVQLERMTANADWVVVSGHLTRLCNSWAARRDLQVYLGRDGGNTSAVAFFNPRDAQIEINSDAAFGKGMDGTLVGDLTDRIELSKYPICGGLALHEAAHARYSTSDLTAVRAELKSQRVMTVFELLEECRVEGRISGAFPADGAYLRASTRELLMGDDPSAWSPRAAAQLLVGRHEVGVLEASDVKPVEAHLLANGWTTQIISEVRRITQEFMVLEDSGSELQQQYGLARELDRIMPVDPQTEGSDSEADMDGLIEAISESLSGALSGGMMEAIEAGLKAAADEAKLEKDKKDRIQSDNENVANGTFRDSSGGAVKRPSELVGSRAPSALERAAAVKLSKALQNAKYRDRALLEYNSDVPPGRFNGGEAMRLAAARSVGGDTSRFLPFRHKRYQETDEPPLTVGMMSDVSGSMTEVQSAIGTATWVVSDAVYRIDKATAASVYFGGKVYPGLRKGEHARTVATWSGRDGWEDFDNGFRALDGELTLLNGTGARLLIVCSDGQYGGQARGRTQAQARDAWVETCAKSGVGVVWLQLRGQKAPVKTQPGVEVLTIGTDVLGATDAIGLACIRALAHASGL